MCYEEAVRCAREAKMQEALSKRNQRCFALGSAYVEGEGVITRDYDLAIFWLRKSIANGYQVKEAQALIDRIEGVDNGENP
jgi:TPR repeat protein